MQNKLILQGIMVSILGLLFNGCWLNPYKEEFRCTRGPGEGMCGDMNSNYYKINRSINGQIESNVSDTVVITDLKTNENYTKEFDKKLEALWIKQQQNKENIEKNTVIIEDITK